MRPTVEDMNRCIYTSVPSIYIRGVYSDVFVLSVMRKLMEALWFDPLTTTTTTRPSKCCTYPHSEVFPYFSAVSRSVHSNVGKRFGLVGIGRMGCGKK